MFAAGDGSGGRVVMDVDGLPPSARLAVADDPFEALFTPPTASFPWLWAPCCTDGAAIAALGDDFDISVTPAFVSGITRWVALSLNPNGTLVKIDLDMTRSLRLWTPGRGQRGN